MAVVRPFVCRDCRTRLAENERCECKKDRSLDLRTAAGRSALLDEVWGDPSVRRRVRDAARAGATGAGVGTAGNLLDCLDCGTSSTSSSAGCGDVGAGGADALGEAAVFILIILALAIVFVLLYFLIAWIVRQVRAYRDRPRPHGALTSPPPLLGKGVYGRIDAKEEAEEGSPCAAPCLGWSAELRAQRVIGQPVMLRDAWAVGFDVVLDDGRRVRIPAGRIRLEASTSEIQRASYERIMETDLLDELDPLAARQTDEKLSPFPFDHEDEIRLLPGDRVELLNDLELVIDPTLEGDYRTAAGTLVPRDVPRMRKMAA